MLTACTHPLPGRLLVLATLLVLGLTGCKDPRDNFPPVIYNLTLQGGSVEVPASTTTGTGTLTGEYNRLTRVLTFRVIFSFGATGELAFASHIHKGAVGVAGPVEFAVRSWAPDVASGNFSFSITLTEAQAEDLLAGNYYYNLHTNNNAGGALRAQLIGS